MRLKAFLTVIALFLIFYYNLPAYPQDVEEYSQKKRRTISVIKVSGNSSVSTATILSKIKTKPGDVFSQKQLNGDIKRLYNTGFFTDVEIDVEDYKTGVAVTFVVIEKPIVKDIEFVGNRAFRTQKLLRMLKTSKGEMFSEMKLKKDIEELISAYKKRGYQMVKIDYNTELAPEANTVKITINIDEKSRIKIRRIEFRGNKNISRRRLLKSISTRPASLFTSGYFKEEVFEVDLEKIKDLYEKNGFLDVKITAQKTYDAKKRWMYLTIDIYEGKRYVVGDISIKGNIVFPENEIKNVLKMKSGMAFSNDGLRADIISIQQFYYGKGYMMSKVDGSSIVNPETGLVDVTYTIEENELVYINKIKIKGNTKTKDVVIRRELRVYPGERFDGDKLRRSKERLYNLGYFEEVTFDTGEGPAPDKKDLIVSVKESKTGEFSFGGGYSSVEFLIGFVNISQRNFDLFHFPTFTGDGQKLRLIAEFGTIRKNYDLSWTEPWIFDFPLLFGFDLYKRTRLRKSGLGYGYDEERAGGGIRFGKEITEYLYGDLAYSLEDVEISDVSTGASADLFAEESKNRISSLFFKLTQDTRDNIFNPTRGYILWGSIKGAGGFLGGDKNFVKLISGFSTYFTYFEHIVLELRAQIGVADAFEDTRKIPIYERFYTGGANTIRGYRERRVGPKDPGSNIPIGGEGLLLGGVELTFPLYERVLKGAVFYDIGNVWAKWTDIGEGGLKSGVGAGIRVKTPIGPVKLDFGFPLSDVEGEEKKGRFHFSISQGF